MTEQIPWNHVVLGDGTRAVLVPGIACVNRIIEADGHRSCNHTDATPCDRPGHQTISLYEVIREGDRGYFPPSALPRRYVADAFRRDAASTTEPETPARGG